MIKAYLILGRNAPGGTYCHQICVGVKYDYSLPHKSLHNSTWYKGSYFLYCDEDKDEDFLSRTEFAKILAEIGDEMGFSKDGVSGVKNFIGSTYDEIYRKISTTMTVLLKKVIDKSGKKWYCAESNVEENFKNLKKAKNKTN